MSDSNKEDGKHDGEVKGELHGVGFLVSTFSLKSLVFEEMFFGATYCFFVSEKYLSASYWQRGAPPLVFVHCCQLTLLTP